MEPYGAQRSQPVATGGKWEDADNGSDKRKPLPWVATHSVSRSMVRRGSPVRVRKRAPLFKPFLRLSRLRERRVSSTCVQLRVERIGTSA